YRLPWNYADNGISWLEPTTKCNLRCEGCYRDLTGPGHKTLEEVRADLEVFRRLRKSDCMSIAGGDPLVYPQILELVKMIKEMGWKPIVNTNGLALNEDLLRDLKKSGVFGFTFHIDTSQKRPDVRATTEEGLNGIRLHYAEMLARVGGLSCSFNATVSERTVQEVPNMVQWAQKHVAIVHTMVFILYRSPTLSGDFDFYANGKKIDIGATYKETAWGGAKTLMTADLVEKIREADSLYEPAAYLNGTAKPDSLKWLLASRIVLNGKVLGYVSPHFMELLQTVAHLFTGTYLAYAKPKAIARGKLASFLGGLVDKKMRSIFFSILGNILTNPSNLFRPAYLQSLMIIQPINFELDGRQDMCDSCPDITVHNGKLVWSCRLEEINNYGVFLNTVPKWAGINRV
ncbi:MAG TPA: radical SAM protein, partial [Thermodesulfobacteriota bacterium]|nr:radical SAM protein [Thermodesulfobacteriota bacterium]